VSAILAVVHEPGRPVDRAVVASMQQRLAHHGTAATWTADSVALSHVDRQRGDRTPRVHLRPEAGLALVADLRLDNRDDLQRALGSHPAPRAERSDADLLLSAYERWGAACVEHLIGAFAFVLWDGRRRRLVGARDPLGMRPFCYAQVGSTVACASEPKALLALPGITTRLDEVRLAGFLAHYHHEVARSFFADIARLPPAHLLIAEDGHVTTRRYWDFDLRARTRLPSPEAYAEALREHVAEAVRCRLPDEGTTGILLSGGLDSSSVACLAVPALQERGQDTLPAFASVLPDDHEGPEEDERYYLDVLVQHQPAIDVHPVWAEGRTPFDGLERRLWLCDGPFRDAFHYMTDALYESARQHGVRVLLDGYGGDYAASYVGRGAWSDLLRRGRWIQLVQLLRRRDAVYGLPGNLAHRLIKPIIPDRFLRAYRRLRGIDDADVLGLHDAFIHPDFARRIDLVERIQAAWRRKEPYRTVADVPRAIYDGLMRSGSIPGAAEDRAPVLAQHGMQAHSPMLDVRLLQYCLSIPSEQFVYDGYPRGLIRRAMQDVLPAEVRLRRDKMPFTPDFHRRVWASRDKLREELSAARVDGMVHSYLDVDAMQRALEEGPHLSRARQVHCALQLTSGMVVMQFLRMLEAEYRTSMPPKKPGSFLR
jgi:asparagine synthase (glutamine-hydrolysing)